MKRNRAKDHDSVFFWETAACFLNHELPKIRKKSTNTVTAYRISLNICIDYLEDVKGIQREKICFCDLKKENLKDFLVWMGQEKKWSPKTCNLRMTAVRSLLSFAAEECMDITYLFAASKTIRSLNVPGREIEYFEDDQLSGILEAPGKEKRSERRNRMLLILGYDAAMRVGELIDLNVENIHLDAEIPYVRILGKGEKYRSVPLMRKTVEHLRKYLYEFHGDISDPSAPLFYAVTHGRIHSLSDDCIQKVLKKYTEKCRVNGIHMPANVHFHMLRKTRAMNLYQEGCPLSYIQQMLGHENISTTSGFYAFVTLNTLAEAIGKANPDRKNTEKSWKKAETAKILYRL